MFSLVNRFDTFTGLYISIVYKNLKRVPSYIYINKYLKKDKNYK